MSARPLALALALFALACSDGTERGTDDDAPGEMTQVDPPSNPIPAGSGGDGGADSGDPGACDGADLCARSIEECGVAMDPGACEAWYADAGNCRDMAAYEACNCDCIEEPERDGYFACGEFCWQGHCA